MSVHEFLLQEIESTTTRSIKAGKNQYICPFCHSGTGSSKTGAFTFYPETNTFYCFSCQRSGDIGDFIAYKNNISKNDGWREALKKYEGKPAQSKNTTPEEKPSKTPEELYRESYSNKVKSDYFFNRGFSQETISRFNLYCYKEKHGFINAIIPNGENHVIERGTQGDFKGNFGETHIFNLKDLYNDNDRPVFITEGWADCLSFYEAGEKSISINSDNNYMLVVEALKDKPTTNKLILALDNDKKGKDTAEKLKAELEKIGYPSCYFPLPEQFNDVNELFIQDKKSFYQFINESLNIASRLEPIKEKNYDDNYLINQIDDLLEDVKGGKYKPLSTGIKAVDSVLSGGLCAGLTVLAAESQMGKSTLAMNIAENLAVKGQDVIYFSLEMSKTQLLLRGLSRQSFLLMGKNGGYSTGELKEKLDQLPDLKKILDMYKYIAEHLIIHENKTGLMTVEEICEKVESYIKEKKQVPVIIVDYLQYIYDSTRTVEIQQIDYAVMKLKALSIKYDAIIIVISSVNRKSYGDMIDMDSLKGSGKIEFTAEYFLGLSLEKSQSKSLSKIEVDAELKKEPREMILQVLKGRNIENRKTESLRYFSRYNHFEGLLDNWEAHKESEKNNLFD